MAQVALALGLVLFTPLRVDAQHPLGDGHLDVLVRIDARKLGPDDQRLVLLVLVDPDHLVGHPVGERERTPERQHVRPLVEQPVEPREWVERLYRLRFTLAQSGHVITSP
jgi:hypothetical protein